MAAATQRVCVSRLMSACLDLAARASAQVREVASRASDSDKGVKDKTGMQDLQTEADRLAEGVIVGGLMKAFPALRIVAEEATEDEGNPPAIDHSVSMPEQRSLQSIIPLDTFTLPCEDTTVWVDPLDGTAEFVDGILEPVCVLIGISVQSVPVAGVVHRPFCTNNVSETVWAAKGHGVHGLRNGIPNAPSQANRPLRLAMSARRPTPQLAKALEMMQPAERVPAGGCGHKMMMLVEGHADAYIMPTAGTKRWDSCAGSAVLFEAGLQVSDSTGKPIEYNPESSDRKFVNREGVVACWPEESERVLAALRDSQV